MDKKVVDFSSYDDFFGERIFPKFLLFSYIGLFLSIIPNVLNESCTLQMDVHSLICIIFVIIGFIVSFYLGDIQGNNEKIKQLINKH